ncbi:uncharacterized protein LOC135149877 [Daucus carota subsp. sativus]|uniref:uncharacterized protein LOC135149877 n=1 Tax=Daucus carota subsp. sativus TaxID=79200 RepID=UPI003082C342
MSWARLSRHKTSDGMSFRDFRDFNLAMLGKQGWRFLSNPGSLVARLFKTRYFSNTNFLEVPLGNNPSFVWRSIWEARSLLRAGARWMVGAGTNISIANQPWLQDEENPYITSSSPSFENNTVASLMTLNDRSWDVEIIRDLFNVRDQQCILRTPIRNSQSEDTIYWCKESSGVFTVKSAYKFLQEQKGVWRRDDNNSLWAKLWRIKAPPKALNLVWRALSFCLPTMVMLSQKRVPVLPSCPVCNGEDETIFHAMVGCPFAAQCWQSLFPDFQQHMGSEFEGWLDDMLGKVTSEKRPLVITVCWAIWKALNDKHWNHKQVSMNAALVSAKNYLVQWQNSQARSTQARGYSKFVGDGATSWVKP